MDEQKDPCGDLTTEIRYRILETMTREQLLEVAQSHTLRIAILEDELKIADEMLVDQMRAERPAREKYRQADRLGPVSEELVRLENFNQKTKGDI